MKRLVLLFFLLIPICAASEEINGKSYFKEGLILYNSGLYNASIERFSKAHYTYPLLKDYALFFIAKSHLELKNNDKALESLELILTETPDTPLKKNIKAVIIRTLIDNNKPKAVSMLDRYVKDYPDDHDMKFLLAKTLKEENPALSKTLLIELFIKNCPLSSKALKELKQSDITAGILLKRGVNLNKAFLFKESESVFREALAQKPVNELRKELQTELALSLFKQKKYHDAGELHTELGDMILAAQSFSRAQELERFNGILNNLISQNDKKAGSLLVLSALHKKRQGNTDEALKILSNVIAGYPSESEQALWQSGWLYYIQGNYSKAYDTFSVLASSARNNKYIYWKARSAEKSGMPSEHIYADLTSRKDFYNTLVKLKSGIAKRISSAGELKTVLPLITKGFERQDDLYELGLKNEARLELVMMSRNSLSDENTLAIAYKLNSMGEYTRAVSLAQGLPESSISNDILYPLAFWGDVKETSRDFGLDPLLILSVMREESRYDPDAFSPAGAIGLLQLMPDTANRMADSLKLSRHGTKYIYDAGLNIRLGSYYLSRLLNKFGSISPSLAAYNAGEHRVKDWLSKWKYDSYDEFIEDIPFLETREYVKRILTSYYTYKTSNPDLVSMDFKDDLNNKIEVGDPALREGASGNNTMTPGGIDPFNRFALYGIINR